MQVTNISVKPVENMPRLKGYALFALDQGLALNDVMIIQTDHGMCIEFPKNPKTGQELVAPLNHEIRNHIQSLILKAYRTGVDYFLINKPRKIYRLASTNHMLPSRKR